MKYYKGFFSKTTLCIVCGKYIDSKIFMKHAFEHEKNLTGTTWNDPKDPYYSKPFIQPKDWNIISAFKKRDWLWFWIIVVSCASGFMGGLFWKIIYGNILTRETTSRIINEYSDDACENYYIDVIKKCYCQEDLQKKNHYYCYIEIFN